MAFPNGETKTRLRTNVLLTRAQVGAMIADGRTIIIVDGKVLKVDAWSKYHPGGAKALLHMVGRDATDEVNALHSPETRQFMSKFQIGKIEGQWQNFLPPIQGGDFKAYGEVADEDYEDVKDDQSSSSRSSTPESPLFDVADIPGVPRRRQRSGSSGLCEVSSVSSLSSMESKPDEDSKKPSIIDARTQCEIDLDLSKYPALDLVSQNAIAQKYRLLCRRVQDEGLFECNYTAYLIESCRYIFLFTMFFTFLRCGWYGTSGLFLGFLWHQLVFTAHDAGHLAITHNFMIDTIIGTIIADFIGGLSLGWWKHNHNVHHIVTNSPEHDPDIEHMPFFAISHRFFDSLESTYYDRVMTYDLFAKFIVRYQHYLYYPILLFGRFNLYFRSWEYLIRGLGPRKGPAWWHRWLEITGQVFFWYWFGYKVVYQSIPSSIDRLIFVMVSHMSTAVLHLQITLSHFAMSTADLGTKESFPQKMLRTTMDVDCPEWLDFFHGGLQFQAIHHLFPRMPRHNFRRTQRLVQEFCREVDIPYVSYSFVNGNKEVIGRLADIAQQAAILAECQKTITEKGKYSLH